MNFLRSVFWRYALLGVLSYHLLYLSFKYVDPTFSLTGDWKEYYQMVLRPFDYGAGPPAPFIYRQLGPAIAHVIYVLGIHYPTQMQFNEPGYDASVLFAMLASNYIALVTAAVLAGFVAERLVGEKSPLLAIVAGCLCLLSFMSLRYVVTGLNEGWSWVLMILAFWGLVERRFWMLAIACALSVIQRETVPLAVVAIGAVRLVLGPSDQRRWAGVTIAVGMAALGAYLLCRALLIPVQGYENQIQAQMLATTLAGKWSPTREILFQGALSQNLFILLLGVAAWRLWPLGWRAASRHPCVPNVVGVIVAAALLWLVGVAADVGNNVGRVIGILHPVVAALSAAWLSSTAKSRGGQA